MQADHSNPKHTRIALILVCWVILACFARNTGLIPTLGYNKSSVASEFIFQSQTNNDESTSECDLAEKLLSLNISPFESHFIPYFLLAIAILLWLLSQRNTFTVFTEPIVLQKRLYLHLCVFRE